MKILDGKTAREAYTGKLIERVKALSITPCLVIIQVGKRSDSDAFIKAKKSFAQKIGVKETHVMLDEKASQGEVLEQIKKYNEDKTVQGIIVQLPMPAHLDADTIIDSIDPDKDTDGLTPNTPYVAATARGISDLLKFYEVGLKNKKVTIVGQSKLVGKPMAEMCRKEGAIVTVCDSKTENVEEKTKIADILMVAIGKPNFIDEKYVSKGQTVIDVGITRQAEGSALLGDVNFQGVKDIAGMITPVPGGVGQMTVLALFENLIDACYNAK
ncbi:MAG: bifunctional 5,10-methylenetetrahydrofolate dehydrogenase/5,10-methenyltetrahydrofolate cyclohydrolase [bacterium]|nr:bifunctional 5,10-methylenetetrahydrofolate dehydrogenase/5,10-methenyltetrahydrofolate cyclohydrolase [bacterium]